MKFINLVTQILQKPLTPCGRICKPSNSFAGNRGLKSKLHKQAYYVLGHDICPSLWSPSGTGTEGHSLKPNDFCFSPVAPYGGRTKVRGNRSGPKVKGHKGRLSGFFPLMQLIQLVPCGYISSCAVSGFTKSWKPFLLVPFGDGHRSSFARCICACQAQAGKSSKTQLKNQPKKLFISCKQSRIESNTSFYSCFYLGPFEAGQSITVANALRRTLLSDLVGVAITSVEIQGVNHEYESLAGVREPVLDILLNLKEIVLKKNFSSEKKKLQTQIGYLRARGPGLVKASDLILPSSIKCVDPNQYIATLSEDGILNMKFYVHEGKNYFLKTPSKTVDLNEIKTRRYASLHVSAHKKRFNKQKKLHNPKYGNLLYLDAVFMPVTKVNYMIETNEQANDKWVSSKMDSFSSKDAKPISSSVLNSKSFMPSLSSFAGSPLKKKGVYVNPATAKLEKAGSPSFWSPSGTGKGEEGDLKEGTNFLSLESKHCEFLQTLVKASKETQKRLLQKKQLQRQPYIKTTFKLPSEQIPNQHMKHNIMLEIWTNGSVHPRKALYDSFKKILSIFSKLQKIKIVGSMLKSDKFYKKLITQKLFVSAPINSIQNTSISKTVMPLNTRKDAKAKFSQLELYAQKGIKNKKGPMPPEGLYFQNTSGLEQVFFKNTKFKNVFKQYFRSLKLAFKSLVFKKPSLKKKPQNLAKTATMQQSWAYALPVGPLLCPSGIYVNPATAFSSKAAYVPVSEGDQKEGLPAFCKPRNSAAGDVPAGYKLEKLDRGLNSYPAKLDISPIFFKTPKGTKSRGLDRGLYNNRAKKNVKQKVLALEFLDIGNLNISLRAYTCLKRANINTVNQLVSYTKKQLLKIPNFGTRSLEEIEERLNQFGFFLTN